MRLFEWTVVTPSALLSDEINRMRSKAERLVPGPYEPWVYVDQKKVSANNLKVKKNAKISLVFPLDNSVEINKKHILYDADGLLAVFKDSNLSSQPTREVIEDNMYFLLKAYYLAKAKNQNFIPYIGLHHRLDRQTSGIMLFTTRRSANAHVSKLFQQRLIQKTYLAVVYNKSGKEIPNSWSAKNYIQRSFSPENPFKFKISDKGDEAIADFKFLGEVSAGKFLIACFPKTGRTHQLRLQLEHVGLPIVGDAVYGSDPKNSEMFLHAYQIDFPSARGELLQVSANLPDTWGDVKQFLSEKGKL